MGIFNVCLVFSEKWFLYSSSKFCFFEPFINIQLHKRFNVGIWQTLEQVHRKFQHGEKIFAKFQSEPCFPRKMVLYLLTKFGILNMFIGNSSMRRTFLGNLDNCIVFWEKNWFYFSWWNLGFCSFIQIINQKIRFRLLTNSKSSLNKKIFHLPSNFFQPSPYY